MLLDFPEKYKTYITPRLIKILNHVVVLLTQSKIKVI